MTLDDVIEDCKTGLVTGMAYAMITAAFLGGPKHVKPLYSAENYKQKTKIEQITTSEIETYMSMKTCEEILAGTDVKYATYQGRGRTDLHKLLKTDKPAMVLFYSNKPGSLGDESFSKRDAIIFRKLIEKYGDKINFVCYNREDNINAKKTRYDGMATDDKLYGNSFMRPSIVMFSYFDLLKGETPEKNDGKLKQIDILRGGPKNINYLKKWMKNLPSYWINPLLIQPNEKYIYLFKNTDNVTKIKY